MFKIAREPTFTHTVTVMTPVDGGHREESLKVTYRVIPTEQAAGYGDTEDGTRAFLRAAVVRLDDLVGDDEKPVSYSDELREQLLGQPHVRFALVRGYTEAISKAKLGN